MWGFRFASTQTLCPPPRTLKKRDPTLDVIFLANHDDDGNVDLYVGEAEGLSGGMQVVVISITPKDTITKGQEIAYNYDPHMTFIKKESVQMTPLPKKVPNKVGVHI